MKSSTRLALVALLAGLISVVCLGCAYTRATANDSGSSEIISRELAWDESHSLSLGVRSVVRYAQTDGPGRVIARGPHRSVSTLVVSGGEIHDQLLHSGATLDLTIFAPSISSFHLGAGSRLSIENYDQKILSLSVEGGAVVEGAGRADAVSIEMRGTCTVNLSRFAADTATASLGGMSTLVAPPSRVANLTVRNFASAVLLARPADLHTTLTDSGRVIDATRN